MAEPIMVTVTGNVATHPTLNETNPQAQFASFRLASTPRHRNADGEWTDGKTEWITVKVWREPAKSVADCVHKGDPVIVYGRARIEEWTDPSGQRSSLTIDARAVGPDTTRGRTTFSRVVRNTQAAQDAAIEDGEETGGAEDGEGEAQPPPGVDAATGEVTDPAAFDRALAEDDDEDADTPALAGAR